MNENEISKVIVNSAYTVHNELGPGLLESAYEECLMYELIKNGLHVEKQKPIPVKYKDIVLECGYRLDLIVESKVIVEVKAIESLSKLNLAQILTYLRLTNCKLGFLINFNTLKIKDGIKRVVNGL